MIGCNFSLMKRIVLIIKSYSVQCSAAANDFLLGRVFFLFVRSLSQSVIVCMLIPSCISLCFKSALFAANFFFISPAKADCLWCKCLLNSNVFVMFVYRQHIFERSCLFSSKSSWHECIPRLFVFTELKFCKRFLFY